MPQGCTAETEVTAELLEKLKKAKQLTVGSPDLARRSIAFGIPMTEFAKVLAGPSGDKKEISEARKRTVLAIRERIIEFQKKAKEDAEAKKAAGGKAPAPKK